MLSQLRDVGHLVEAASDEAERASRISPEVLQALRRAGCFRMATPSAYGGEDLPLPTVLAVVEELARTDGAVGWVVGQVALSQIMLSYLPRAALDRIYADEPDVMCAGATTPKGRAVAIGGSWRVNGRWPLVSGALDASWIYLQCFVVQRHKIQLGPDGLPSMRMAIFPAHELEVIETWDAVGLRATASHDVEALHAICPAGWSVELANSAPRGVITRIPPSAQGGLFVAATVLGIAAGALDALCELAAAGKRPAFSQLKLADRPLLQNELGEALLSLEAAHALLHSECARADAHVAYGCELGPQDTARIRAASVKAIELAVGSVDAAYRLAGASAVYASSTLQRRLRDVHTATQHFTAGRAFYAPLGALLAGANV